MLILNAPRVLVTPPSHTSLVEASQVAASLARARPRPCPLVLIFDLKLRQLFQHASYMDMSIHPG